MTPIQDHVRQSKQAMDKAVEAVKREFATVRTGKATTSLLDLVKVEAYGSEMPLNQVASVAAPEPKLLTVQPWDKALIKAVEKAILASDLGLNPANDGNLIRIPLPPLTEERRRELVKVVHLGLGMLIQGGDPEIKCRAFHRPMLSSSSKSAITSSVSSIQSCKSLRYSQSGGSFRSSSVQSRHNVSMSSRASARLPGA